MSYWKSFALALVGAACLAGETTNLAHAQCNLSVSYSCATEWSSGNIIGLENLSGSSGSFGTSINASGQIVGSSFIDGVGTATEWSNGEVVNLGAKLGSWFSAAEGINATGQIVGYNIFNPATGGTNAIEWITTTPST